MYPHWVSMCSRMGEYVFKKIGMSDQPWLLLYSCLIVILSLSHCLQNLHLLWIVAQEAFQTGWHGSIIKGKVDRVKPQTNKVNIQ